MLLQCLRHGADTRAETIITMAVLSLRHKSRFDTIAKPAGSSPTLEKLARLSRNIRHQEVHMIEPVVVERLARHDRRIRGKGAFEDSQCDGGMGGCILAWRREHVRGKRDS